MTIPFTNGNNGLFDRLGKIGADLINLNTFQNQLATDVQAINTAYATSAQSTDDESMIDGIGSALTNGQSSASSLFQFLITCANNTVTGMVQNDNPQLSNSDIQTAWQEVIRQMKVNSQSVLAIPVSASVSANAGNNGNGVLVSTVLRPDGLKAENLFAESIKANCISDSSSGSIAGNETFNVLGTQAETTQYMQDWPLGSGGSTSVTAVSPSTSTVLDGDFESWTGSVPTGWSVVIGGSTISEDTSNFYTGSASMKWSGDGSTLTAVEQAVTLSPLSLYAANLWVRVPAGTTGILRVALVSGGSVINDQAGNANSFTLDLSTLTASTWTALNGVFRTPYIMPSTVDFELSLTTAINSAHSLNLDRVCLGSMTQLYAGGPSFSLFSGSQNWYVNDGFVCTASATHPSNQKSWQVFCQRLFNFNNLVDAFNLPLQLPSVSSSPTVPDSLL